MKKPEVDYTDYRAKYRPARQYLAGYNQVTGVLRKTADPEAYAKDVVMSVDPADSPYHKGRWDRAMEYLEKKVA